MTEVSYRNEAYAPVLMTLKRFVMYGGAGAVGTAAHFMVLFATLRLVGPVAASTLGAIVGCIINYFLAHQYVFASTTSCARSLPRFASVAIFGIAINAMIINAFVGVLPIALSQVVASGTVLLLGYTLNKRWTFDER